MFLLIMLIIRNKENIKENFMNIEKESDKLYSKNFKKFGLDMNIFVSLVTAILVLGFIIFTILRPDNASEFFQGINDYLNINF